jgi:hypothetical protein
VEVIRVAAIAAEYYLNNTTYDNALELDKINVDIANAQDVDPLMMQTYLEHRAAVKFVIRLAQKKELASSITLV